MSSGSVKYVKKANWKRIFIILLILGSIFTVGKLTNFLGKFTGEVASDGNTYYPTAPTWEGEVISISLDSGDAAIPAVDTLAFTSDTTTQLLQIGNPEINRYPMSFTLRLQDRELYVSKILKAGTGLESVDLKAYFKPNQYDATLLYTFYTMDGSRLKVLETVEHPVKLDVTGSIVHFQDKDL